MHSKSSLLLATMLSSIVPAAGAQQPAETAAPPVEVTAFRVPVLLTETTQGVTVLGPREIEERRPASVVDLLQSVPGVYVDQVGSPGGVANVYIRGSDPEQTLVLIDGVRVNDPMLSRGGSYDFSALDVAGIERIEVVRAVERRAGAADAMGGVISIVTKRPAQDGVQGTVGGGLGGRDYGTLYGNVAGGSDRVRFSINASTLQDGRDRDGGTIDRSTFDGALSFQPTDALDIRLFARRNDSESTGFPDSSGGILYSVNRDLERREADATTLGADLALRPRDDIGLRLQVSRYERDEDIDSPGVAPPPANPFGGLPATVSRTEFTRDTLLLSASVKLPLDSDLTVGYERLEEEGENRSVRDLPFFGPTPGDFRLTRDTDSGFAQLKSKPVGNLVTLLDLRHDRVSNLGSETSAGAGVRYDFSASGTSVKARYAEGFRPPSFFALGDPLVGNTSLVSETSRSVEIGVEQILLDDRLTFGVTAFRTRFKNLIDFDPGLFLLVNRNSVKAEGIETQVAFRPFDRLNIVGSYTHVETEIVDSPENLRNRPKDRASLSVTYAFFEAWQLSWNTLWVGKFHDFSVPTGDIEADSYSRSDVAVSRRWQRLTATVAVDNVFNEHYQPFVGFEDPGVRLRAALSASF
jgi:vitamin B12 transporter